MSHYDNLPPVDAADVKEAASGLWPDVICNTCGEYADGFATLMRSSTSDLGPGA